MKCDICNREDASSVMNINNKWHCGDCSTTVFLYKWLKLKKKYTKLNRQYKSLLNSNKEG